MSKLSENDMMPDFLSLVHADNNFTDQPAPHVV